MDLFDTEIDTVDSRTHEHISAWVDCTVVINPVCSPVAGRIPAPPDAVFIDPN